MCFTGFNYIVTHDGTKYVMMQNNPTSRTKPWVPANWPDRALQSRVLHLSIVTTVLPHVPSGSVKLFTQLKWKAVGTIFRTNTSYGKSGKSWHDWANIDWDPDSDEAADVIPGRLIWTIFIWTQPMLLLNTFS
jgi:hypothetical protein